MHSRKIVTYMLYYTFFILIFFTTIANAMERDTGPLPEEIFYHFFDRELCAEDLFECSRYRFPEKTRVDLSFYTMTHGDRACDQYWEVISELRKDDLIRFLNRGVALLVEDFGIPNAPHWIDMPSYMPIRTTKLPEGFDRVQLTIKLQRELIHYPGANWQDRFTSYLNQINYTPPTKVLNSGIEHRGGEEPIQGIGFITKQQGETLLRFLYDNELPYVAYRAREVSTAAVSSDSAMIPELLGIVDEKHWLLGRKMLYCQFVVDVIYVLTLDPPVFRHRVSIGISPYCGDRRIHRGKWKQYSIEPKRLQEWRNSLSKRILETYREARNNDPFLRIMGINIFPESDEREPKIIQGITRCPMPWE